MRIINTIFSLLFLFTNIFAQNTPEQLQVKLSSIEDINERYHLKLDYAYKHRSAAYDNSYKMVTSILSEFKDGRNMEILAKSQCYYGGLLIMADSSQKAKEYLFKSLDYYQTVGDHEQLSRIYNNISIIYKKQLDYPSAINYQKKCIAQRTKHNQPLHSNYNNLGSIYFDLGDYEKAIFYFKLSKPFYEKSSNKYKLAKVYSNLSVCYNELDSFQIALDYGLKAVNLIPKHHNKFLTTLSHCNLGSVYSRNKMYEQALYYYDIALQESKATNNQFHKTIALNNLGFIYTELDSLNLAEELLLNSLKTSKEFFNTEDEMKTYQLLASLYQKKNNVTLAIKYFNEFVKATDSIKQVNLAHQLPQILTESTTEINNAIDVQSVLIQPKSRNTLFSIFIIFGMEAFLVLLFLGTRFTNLFSNQKTKDIADVMLTHFTLGCFISVLGYWYYPKESMHQGPFILIGILLSSVISTLILLRKLKYTNVRN